MDCLELENSIQSRSHVNFNRYSSLHPEGRRLISGWFNRAWEARDCEADDCFEAFIFAWFSVNGWAACVTGLDNDRPYLNALMRDQPVCQKFNQLVAAPGTPLAFHAARFAEWWPIFEVKSLRRRRITRFYSGEREKVVNFYLTAGATEFEPGCWKRHKDAGEQVPVDWPHTLRALYRVRCNLFHGEKAAHSEMDQRVVSSAFRTLVHFFKAAGYLER